MNAVNSDTLRLWHARAARYREALEWYTDVQTIAYQTKPNAIGTFAKDNGQRAREALREPETGGETVISLSDELRKLAIEMELKDLYSDHESFIYGSATDALRGAADALDRAEAAREKALTDNARYREALEDFASGRFTLAYLVDVAKDLLREPVK